MSEHVGIETRRLVFRVAGLGKNPRYILDAIADRANENGRAWPSEQLLAESTDMSVRSVRDAIRELEDRGILKITRRGWHQSNIYEIQLRMLAELPRVRADQTGTDQIAGLATRDRQISSVRPAEIVKQTGKTDRQNRPAKQTGIVCRLSFQEKLEEKLEPPYPPRGECVWPPLMSSGPKQEEAMLCSVRTGTARIHPPLPSDVAGPTCRLPTPV